MSFSERAVAIGAVVCAPLALHILPLPRALALLDRWPVVRGAGMHPVVLADRVQRWLSRGVGPWRSTCLTRSAALYTMLKQHGFRPRLHLGVAGAEHAFEAHAWVSLEGTPIADAAANVARYRPLWVHNA